MDYEKAYKEALERAEGIIKYYKEHNRDEAAIEDLEAVFPELKESEDERIRKHIISVLEDCWQTCKNIDYDSSRIQEDITWLEKQGEQKPIIEMKSPEESLGIDSDTYNNIVDECIYGEQKPADMVEPKDYSSIDPHFFKSTDKVEPKFHEGDFIKHNRVSIICKVISVNSSSYYVENIKTNGRIELFNAEQNFHLWTIEDAKDGDVLVGCKGDVILMFRGIGNTEWDDVIDYHYYYDCYREDFIVQEDVNYWGNTENNQLRPATKEQRDLLFQKMKEAGYEWDVEKKELKIIDWSKHIKYEPNSPSITEECPAWSEEDKSLLLHVKCIIDEVWHSENTFGYSREELKEMWNWLDVAWQRLQYPTKEDENWSEEDEETLGWLCTFLKDYGKPFYEGNEENVIDWLKSIKERITWKPSEEQIIVLQESIGIVGQLTPRGECLKELAEQLKKLK